MTKYVERVIKHLEKFPIKDRYNIESLYPFNEGEYRQLLEYEKSLIDPLVGGIYNTYDVPRSGSYEFQFELSEVSVAVYDQNIPTSKHYYMTEIPNYVIRVYFDILPGGSVYIEEDFLDVNIDLINNSDWGWEVENEIKDIMYEFLIDKIPFLENAKTYNIMEIYINYPE
jgi:hypothetical protein